MGRLRGLSAEPDVSAATGIQPAGADDDLAHPTELPAGDYDAAVFENLFPTFAVSSTDPPALIVDTRPAVGVCEVVVFTQDPDARASAACRSTISSCIIEVWADRYRELGRKREVRMSCPFENRGVEVGVTLHHPHGQIYAYPFVPPIAARELAMQREYFAAHATRTAGRCDREGNRRRSPGSVCDVTRPSPSCRSARAIPTKSGLRRGAPAASVADLDSGRATGVRAGAEDRAHEVRPPLGPAVPVHHGHPSGAD